jgi:hypothetical protein
MADHPSPRRRFQFRLRTLFVAVLFAAILCGFAALIRENRRLARELDEAAQRERELRKELFDAAEKLFLGRDEYMQKLLERYRADSRPSPKDEAAPKL